MCGGFSGSTKEEERKKGAALKGDEKLRQLNEGRPEKDEADKEPDANRDQGPRKSVAKMATGIYLKDLFKNSMEAAEEENRKDLKMKKKTYHAKLPSPH